MTPFGKVIIPIVAVLTAATVIVLSRHPLRMTFASPKQAVEQLVIALRQNDLRAAELILGPGSRIIVRSGDDAADRAASRRFVGAYDAHETLTPAAGSRVTLLVGRDNWPFPIPLVRESDGWRFNAGAGKHEILARRIGRDEIDAINECRAFVDAEREYAATDRGGGLPEYAMHLNSARGKRDGLYWNSGGRPERSPLGPAFAQAESSSGHDKAQPYNGYYFRILTAQGPAAKGGAYSYFARGKMIGGFALVAYPAKYGSTGIMTFIVNDDDIVYQKDLGPDTNALAVKTADFNPAKGWTQAKI